MRIGLVQSDVLGQPGQVALSVALRLRELGHQVTLLVPQTEMRSITSSFVDSWQAVGFAWIPVAASRLFPDHEHFPRDRTLATSRRLAETARAFDAVWFFEAFWAMPLLRERRFSERCSPLVIVHATAGREIIPSCLEEINRDFATQYSLRWADLVRSEKDTDDLETTFAKLEARRKEDEAKLQEHKSLPYPAVSTTVCIPYFEAAAFLPATLQSLERQTSTEFTVVVVDDGSHTEEACSVFDDCAERYSVRGWKFIRQANRSAGAARNRASRDATTEFLMFLDADDIVVPTAIERFLHAMRQTGDECLVAPNYGFNIDPDGSCTLLYEPPGNSLIGSIADDMHGGSCIFVRREAFWSIGGFTEHRGLGFEDYEFHARFNLKNLRWDILPEYLYRYRMPGMKNVSRSTPVYPSHRLVLRWYEDRLTASSVGLHDLRTLPLALASAFRQEEETARRLRRLEDGFALRQARRPSVDSPMKLLLLTCNFPFGIVSGWHMRVKQLIRHFGSRYEVTLMTRMPREEFAPASKEALRYLHAVLGVEGSNIFAGCNPELPYRVREHCIDTFQAALRSLPTEQYHAAIVDQIFMAECRHDLDTKLILTEHNIESNLLRQAAERSWNHALPDAYRNSQTEAERMKRYEDDVWPQFDLRAAVSETDRDLMEQRIGAHRRAGRTVVAANGADPKSWLPEVRFRSQTVFFPGHLAYFPNVDAVEFLLRDIWPKVHRVRPDVRLILAGREPSENVQALVASSHRGSGMGVELVANPRSMEKVARRASISVAPLRLGSGTRCKILESMAWGLPVVSTTLGAEGIAVVDQEHILLRDDAEQIADAIIRLLSDEVLWKHLRVSAKALIAERYSWERVFSPLEDALLELVC